MKRVPKFKRMTWVVFGGKIFTVKSFEIVGEEIYYDLEFNRDILKSIPEKKIQRRE